MERLGHAEGSAASGFARRLATSSTDRVALLLLSGVTSAVLLRSGWQWQWQGPGPPRQLLYLAALLLLLNACLYWLVLAPSSWRRWRVAVLSAVRLAVLPGVLLVATAYYQLLTPGHGSGGGDGSGGTSYGALAWLHLLFVLSVGSGALMLALVAVSLQLPPVLGAALQLASTLIVTTTNSTQCAAQYLQHQHVAARMHTLYSWLQPAIAPLEPLLWAAGIPAGHPFRRCYAVLLVFQVWGGLVLPTLVVAAQVSSAYRAYRTERLEAWLLQSRRQEREEQRYWSRAAAQHRRLVAVAGIHQNGSAASPALQSCSSSQSSPDSSNEAEAVAVQARALMESLLEAPAPPGLLLPGDWQYEAALQAHLLLRRLNGWPALPLGAGLCLLYAWHVLAFP